MRTEVKRIEVPMYVRSTSGSQGAHWGPKSVHAQRQRDATIMLLRTELQPVPLQLPLKVKFTRIANRQLDGRDNLASAFKHMLDGVADYYGLKSDRYFHEGDRVEYAQEHAPKNVYRVRLDITRLVDEDRAQRTG